MKKESAVEFLFKEIYGDTGHIGSYTTDGKDAFEAFEKAKALEREQIIDAHIEGQRVFDKHPHTQWTNDQAEQYYTETYKGGEQ